MKRIIVILIFFLAGIISFVNAQEPFFRQVPLPGTTTNHRINAMCIDSKKVIWLGTSEGMFRFTGYEFDKVVFADSTAPVDITSLASLPGGGIAIGTRTGKIYTYFEENLKTLNTGENILSSAISGIVISPQKDIWFGTLGDGLFRISSSQMVERYSKNDGLGDNYIYTLVLDSTNRIWTGSDGGLSVADISKNKVAFTTYSSSEGLPDNIVRQLCIGPQGTIGIGTEEKGFCIFNPATKRFSSHTLFENWNFGPVSSVLKLDNEFWIGTSKSGIIDFEFQGYKRTRHFKKETGFDGNNVNCMMTDHEGNVWIGAGHELYFSPGEKIEYKKSFGNKNITNIRTILADQQENIWFSNDSALYCYRALQQTDDDLLMPLKGTPFSKLKIISLYEDIMGFIWMGTFDYGVLRFDPDTKTGMLYTAANGLINSSVLSIDGDGEHIWFATLGGVSRCTLTEPSLIGTGDFVSFSEENGLGNNFIYKVFVDSKKRVWFATDGKGITCFANNQFKNYSEPEGLKSKVIYSITEDLTGNLWLSSANDGLFRFDGNSFRQFSITQGLSEINISALAADRKGNLIIVHKKAIDALDTDNFQVVSFKNEVGVTTIDPDLNVIDTDNHGNVWIGTQQGIIKMALDKKAGEKKPVLYLNDILCFLEKVDTTAGNSFPYNRNHISFDYMALWYTDPQTIIYQYKLEGYNNEWITTRDRFITFPNLRPGNYNFRIRASINGNFSNSDIKSYAFVIQLPLWQKTWFLIIIIVIMIGLLLLYIRNRDIRLKTLERQKKEKIESQYEILKNQVNPHFLFNSFNTLITIIDDDKEVAIEYVNKLSDFFRNILSYRERDFITIREELELVETYIFLQQKRYGNNLRVTFDVPSSVRDKNYIPTLALQLIIENCLKHNAISSESPMLIEVFVDASNYLVIRNNINKKLVKEPSTGIGIQNLKNRYRLAGEPDIIVIEDARFYTVKLPLITITR